jgi:hypothetical protein
VSSGYGVVGAINSDRIIAILANGSTKILSLGTCSKIDYLVDNGVPKLGSKIYWTGVSVLTSFYVASLISM